MPPNPPSKRRGRQLIVCSALYVYALQNLFRGQKMTKIVTQHILKCIRSTWALLSNIMCPYHQCLSKLMREQHYKRVSEKNFERIFYHESG